MTPVTYRLSCVCRYCGTRDKAVMIHPSTQLRYMDGRFGYGVFAVDSIPCGTVVWAQDSFDQSFASLHVESLAKPQRHILEKYGYSRQEGLLLLCWDARRFVNHSCAPNILPTRHGFEIAVSDIHAGDQITCDYSAVNLKRPFSCHCLKPECRGVVHPEDAMLCSAGWARQISEVLLKIGSVEQPLWPLIDGESVLLEISKASVLSSSPALPGERNIEKVLQIA